jgi:plasmid stabilization system protein ParE
MQVVWTDTASLGIEHAYNHIADFNPDAAARVAASLRAAGNSLETFPLRGRPVPGTALRELVADYSYIIRYRVSGDTVFIMRVRHAARRPTNP